MSPSTYVRYAIAILKVVYSEWTHIYYCIFIKNRYMLSAQFPGARHYELASSHIFAANRIQNHVETNQHCMEQILLQYIASPLW